MKIIVGVDLGSYSFDPSISTLYLSGIPPFSQENIALITNVTTGTILYNFADPAAGATVNGNSVVFEASMAGMSATDRIQAILNFPDIDETLVREERGELYALGTEGVLSQEDGALVTVDGNLRQVLGTQAVVGDGKVNVNQLPVDIRTVGTLIQVTNSICGCALFGRDTLTVQLSGIWTGTVTFESAANGGDFVAIYGHNVATLTLAATATAAGIYRFNVAGMSHWRCRFSTATSGMPIVTMVATINPSADAILTASYGSQAQPISQKASTYEANTYDTNLATVLGTGAANTTQALPAAVAPVAPTLPATYVSKAFYNTPQIFSRLKVESAGSQRVPFTQDALSNNLVIDTNDEKRLLGEMLVQLQVIANLIYRQIDYNGMPGFDAPSGFVELTKQ